MSKSKLFIGLVALIAFFCLSSHGQAPYQSEYYSVNNGLSFPVVTDIHQGQDGFLWVGTQTGLNKFNGYEFLVFDNLPNSQHKISNNQVEKILEDKYGNLVLVYEKISQSFDLLNPDTYELTPISLGLKQNLRGIPRDILVSNNGEVLVLTKIDDTLRLYQLNTEKQTFELVFDHKENSNIFSAVIHCIQLKNGDFLMNDDKYGLRRFRLKQGTTNVEVENYEKSQFQESIKIPKYPNRSHILHEDQQDRIWVSFQNTPGLYVLQPGSDQFSRYKKIPDNLLYTNLWEDPKGNLLVAHAAGAGSYFKELYCLKPDESVQNLSRFVQSGNQVITAFSLDFAKFLFLGTTTGLQIVQNTSGKVESYLSRDLGTGSISPAIVKGITGDQDGNVYFAQESNFWFKLDPYNKKIDTLILRDSVNQLPLEFNQAMNLLLDQDSLLWGVANSPRQEAMLISYNLNIDSTTVFSEPDYQFKAFCKDNRNGKFWIAAYSDASEKGTTLIQFDPVAPGFEKVNLNGANELLKEVEPKYILLSSENILWLGTNNGLFKIDPSTGNVEGYNVQQDGAKKGLSSGNIYIIHENETAG